jgi:hypothetical protein
MNTWPTDATGSTESLRMYSLRLRLLAEISRRLMPYRVVMHPHTYQLRYIVNQIDAAYCIDAPID